VTGARVRDVHALDAAVREISADPGRTWGVRDAVLGVLAVPVSLGVGLLALVLVPGLPGLAGTGVAMLALAVLTVLLARRAAQQSGGVRRALGLGPPRPADLGRVVGWSLLLLVVQVVTVSLLVQVVPGLRGASPDNVGFVRDEPWHGVLVLAVLAVVVAPLVEELLFRGVVLRGLMLRLGFWPAATTSSALFGVFHAQGSGPEALLLAVATGVFGIGLCVLVRRTGRLAPAIGVHALRNALALGAALQL
jgi:membrane protease YdiL (CAAX protease family)